MGTKITDLRFTLGQMHQVLLGIWQASGYGEGVFIPIGQNQDCARPHPCKPLIFEGNGDASPLRDAVVHIQAKYAGVKEKLTEAVFLPFDLAETDGGDGAAINCRELPIHRRLCTNPPETNFLWGPIGAYPTMMSCCDRVQIVHALVGRDFVFLRQGHLYADLALRGIGQLAHWALKQDGVGQPDLVLPPPWLHYPLTESVDSVQLNEPSQPVRA